MTKKTTDRQGSFSERFKKVDDVLVTTDAVLSEEQIEEDGSRWAAIARSGADLAFAASRGDVNPLNLLVPATAFYRAVLDVEEAQARLLRSIDENVKLLVAEPFKTGRTYLRRAFQSVDDPERSKDYLEDAKRKFYEAHSLTTEPMDEAAVQMHLAICYFLLGYQDDARAMVESAYEKTAALVIELAERTGNTKVLTTSAKWTLLLTGFYGGAILLYKKFKRSRRDRAAQEALRETLPFLHCLAVLHTATGGDADELPAVELLEVSKDQYELVEVAA